MKSKRRDHPVRGLIELGTASRCTLGLPFGEIPEPMGFWHKAGITDR